MSTAVRWKIQRPEGNLSAKKTPDDFKLSDMSEGDVMQVILSYDPTVANHIWMKEGDRKAYAAQLYLETLEDTVFSGFEDVIDFTVTRRMMNHELRDCLIVIGEPYTITRDKKRKVVTKKTSMSLTDILKIPGVSQHSYSNNILEMESTFGIGAARSAIISEISSIYGSVDNLRHITLLADRMTSAGTVTPTTHNGVHKTCMSVLKNASFEKTCDVLSEGATKGLLDECNDVTSSLIVSKRGPFGTGSVQPLNVAYNGIEQKVRLPKKQPRLKRALEEDIRVSLIHKGGRRPKKRRLQTYTWSDIPFIPYSIPYTMGIGEFVPAQ